MTLLDVARGPLLYLALLVFVIGVAWRLYGVWRLGSRPSLAEPRVARTGSAAVRTVFSRMLPRAGFHPSATLATVNPYVYHIGLAIVAFAYLPHIDFIKRLTGISWPALPDAAMYVAAGATIVSLFIALLFRLTDPVLKLISTFDDYFTWVVTMLPLITGMALVAAPSAALEARAGALYPVPLALHLISLELLLAWFPFGKLMHAFLFVPGRAQFGAFEAKRGVRA